MKVWVFLATGMAMGFLAGRLTAPELAPPQTEPLAYHSSGLAPAAENKAATLVPSSADLTAPLIHSPREAFSEAIAAAKFELPRADGTIEVSAVDDLDRALADVTVQLRFQELRNRAPIDREEDFERHLWGRVEREKLIDALSQTGLTDENGALQFAVPSAANYQVLARATGYQLDLQQRNASAGTHIKVRGHLAGAVKIRVFHPDGTPAPFARASLRRPGRGYSARITPDEPFLTADPGTYQLTATVDGRWESSPIEVVLERGSREHAELVLEPRYLVRGAVRWPEEERPGRVGIWLVPREGSSDSRSNDTLPLDAAQWVSPTTQESTFRFAPIKPGAYWLIAKRSGRTMNPSIIGTKIVAVDVRDQDVEQSIDLDPIDPGSAIRATLWQANGTVPRSVEWQLFGILPTGQQQNLEVFRIQLTSGESLLIPLTRTLFDETVDLAHYEHFSLKASSGRLAAQTDRPIHLGDHAELILPQPASVHVTVGGNDFADLVLNVIHEESRHGTMVEIDEHGIAEVPAIGAGRVMFTLRRNTRDRARNFEQTEVIELSPGTNSIRLRGP